MKECIDCKRSFDEKGQEWAKRCLDCFIVWRDKNPPKIKGTLITKEEIKRLSVQMAWDRLMRLEKIKASEFEAMRQTIEEMLIKAFQDETGKKK